MFWNLYIYTVYIVDSGEELKDVEGAPLLLRVPWTLPWCTPQIRAWDQSRESVLISLYLPGNPGTAAAAEDSFNLSQEKTWLLDRERFCASGQGVSLGVWFFSE